MKEVFRNLNKKNAVLKQDLEPYVEKIINYTDEVYGGFKGAPKFPQFTEERCPPGTGKVAYEDR